MYICLCKGITEEKVRQSLAQGHRGKQLLKQLGIGDDCGVCLINALEKIESGILAKENHHNNSPKKTQSVSRPK